MPELPVLKDWACCISAQPSVMPSASGRSQIWWKALIAIIAFGVLGSRTFRVYKDRLRKTELDKLTKNVPAFAKFRPIWKRLRTSFFLSLSHRAQRELKEDGLPAADIEEFKQTSQRKLHRLAVKAALMILAAVVTAGCVTGGMLMLMRVYAYPWLIDYKPELVDWSFETGPLFVALALPGVLAILMSAMTMFSALSGLFESEEDREWWVRIGGVLLQVSVVWIAAHLLVFFGESLNRTLGGMVTGLAAGAAGSLLGASPSTSAGSRDASHSQLNTLGKFLQKHNLILPAIGLASLILITLGLVAAEEGLRHAVVTSYQLSEEASAPLFAAGFGLLAVLLNLGINVNIFSLHGMYRMRLMRAFLGASNVQRRPDDFTNFDPSDSPYECELPCSPGVPLHVVNATLNLTGTKKTAWRQRKAESFTFSSAHAGGWRVGYVRTADYAGSNGVSRATSMAISGAAFNPNMGYNSSPLLSLLMTFFNVRLGFWLPNPKYTALKKYTDSRSKRFLSKTGPSFALKPLMAEAFGLADDTSAWVELSDGGHFEDLALYEMVMRRCKRIIVVDAGADPKYFFEDLGNAIRKIHIDLGIPIELSDNLKMKAGINPENRYCVTGRIGYHCVDKVEGMTEDQIDGQIVYIKAGMTGREPADILQYAHTHPSFPNETTANQFFNESQFESYRHLGSFTIEEITALESPKNEDAAGDSARISRYGTMQRFIDLAAVFHRRKTP